MPGISDICAYNARRFILGMCDISCGMDYTKISIQNFGPVQSGTVTNKKIMIFFGPNNSGKTMVSKLVHAISSYGTAPAHKLQIHSPSEFEIPAKSLMRLHILDSLGLNPDTATTHNKPHCTITINDGKRIHDLKMSDPLDKDETITSEIIGTFGRKNGDISKKHSIYVPAGRADLIRLFYSIAQSKIDLFENILEPFSMDEPAGEGLSISRLQKLLGFADGFSGAAGEFLGIMLHMYVNGLSENLEKSFSKLHDKQISVCRKTSPALVFQDIRGLEFDTELAGTGAVSSFPVLLAADYIKDGGTLILESPESHMDPLLQHRLVDYLCDIQDTKNATILYITHSEHIIDKILSRVSRGILAPSDIGLYYFERKKDTYTRIKEMVVDKSGEAEQPLFQDALDSIIHEFSK